MQMRMKGKILDTGEVLHISHYQIRCVAPGCGYTLTIALDAPCHSIKELALVELPGVVVPLNVYTADGYTLIARDTIKMEVLKWAKEREGQNE